MHIVVKMPVKPADYSNIVWTTDLYSLRDVYADLHPLNFDVKVHSCKTNIRPQLNLYILQTVQFSHFNAPSKMLHPLHIEINLINKFQ